MTRKEIIDFLNEEYNCRKSDMKTIKEMTNAANKVGYNVIKNGVEDYSLEEKGVILDFTKPLKINRSVPELASSKMYNGVPLNLFCNLVYMGDNGFNSELWCYLMNKKDGDIIHFDEILSMKVLWCSSISAIARNLDAMACLGFLRETEDCIEVYAYPLKNVVQSPYSYRLKQINRFAPFKYTA